MGRFDIGPKKPTPSQYVTRKDPANFPLTSIAKDESRLVANLVLTMSESPKNDMGFSIPKKCQILVCVFYLLPLDIRALIF